VTACRAPSGRLSGTTECRWRWESVLGKSETRTLVTSRTQPSRVREVREGQRSRMLSTTDCESCSEASQFLALLLRDELFLSSLTNPLMVTSVVWLPKCFKNARRFSGPISQTLHKALLSIADSTFSCLKASPLFRMSLPLQKLNMWTIVSAGRLVRVVAFVMLDHLL